MIKNWLQGRREAFQGWLDRPLKERRKARQQELISPNRERLWHAEPLAATPGSALGKPDPYRQLGEGPHSPATHGIAIVQGERLLLTHETIKMLKSMDDVFRQGTEKAIDWLQVRTDRRMARNQQTATRQGEAMFPQAATTVTEGSEDEAAFIAAQAAMIVARAKHASDPASADTTVFTKVVA